MKRTLRLLIAIILIPISIYITLATGAHWLITITYRWLYNKPEYMSSIDWKEDVFGYWKTLLTLGKI